MNYVQTVLQGDMEPEDIVFPMKVIVDASILEDCITEEESALLSGPSTKHMPAEKDDFTDSTSLVQSKVEGLKSIT